MKGQTSTEWVFLLIAIFIILGVIVVSLGMFTPMSTNIVERTYTSYWRSADVAILGYSWNETIVNITIQNNFRSPIRINNITLDDQLLMNTSLELISGEESLLVNNFSGVELLPYTFIVHYTNLDNNRNYSFIGDVPFILE